MEYKVIKTDDIIDLAGMYVETFNSPPWNDSWTIETAQKRLHQIINSEDSYSLCAYQEDECAKKNVYIFKAVFNLKESDDE